jgi:hypothetical protein
MCGWFGWLRLGEIWWLRLSILGLLAPDPARGCADTPWTPPPGLCPWTPLGTQLPQTPPTRPLPRYGLALLAQEIGFVAHQSDSAVLRRTDELVIWVQGSVFGVRIWVEKSDFLEKSNFWAEGLDRVGLADRSV